MWQSLMLSLALIAPDTNAACYENCDCTEIGLLEIRCPAGTLRQRGLGDLEIDCGFKSFSCSAFPAIETGLNAPLESLIMTDCALDPLDSLACTKHLMAPTGPRMLYLKNLKNELAASTVEGLKTEKLIIDNSNLKSIPIEALNALNETLQSFRMLGDDAEGSVELRSDQFARSPLNSLEMLEVSSSNIAALPSNAFNGLSALKELYLFDNSISYVHEDAFKGLSELRSLSLNTNPVGDLPNGVFIHTPHLAVISLEDVHLKTLNEGVFSRLQYLKQITIENNIELQLGPRAFSNLPSLTSLIITGSPLSSLPPDLFYNTSALVQLDLQRDSITSLPENIFLTLTSLEKLDLSDNDIETIPNSVFRNCVNLKEIRMDSNRIKVLPEYVFYRLKLDLVSFNGNEIDTISHKSFNQCAIKRLYLSRNGLIFGANENSGDWVKSFIDLETSLETLDLSYNKISSIYDGWRFNFINNLHILNLSHNVFTNLSNTDVQFMQNNITVDLSNNQMTSVYAKLFGQKSNFMIILNNNPFNCDCDNYDFISDVQNSNSNYDVSQSQCNEPKNLQSQLLNKLSTSDLVCVVFNDSYCDCVYRPQKSRTECDCVDLNLLSRIDHVGYMSLRLRQQPKELANLPEYVRLLNLTGLGIRSVPDLPESIRLIDLTNNNLTGAPFLSNPNLTAKLAGNDIHCDCANAANFKFLKLHSKQIIDFDNIICLDGTEAKNKDVGSLCSEYQSAVIGTLCGVFAILVVIVAAVGWYHRALIRVVLYKKRWLLWALPREQQSHKQFDVFVSFAREDERWVCENLLPRLKHLRVIVQDRDWEAGQPLAAQAARAVRTSRRTLVVLSPHYVRGGEGGWAHDTLRLAHQQALVDHRLRTIALLLDIAKNQLNAETRTFLSLAKLICVKSRLVWDKLMYWLPRGDVLVEKTYTNKNNALDVVLDGGGKLITDGRDVGIGNKKFYSIVR